MAKKLIYFVRHGESHANRGEIMQDSSSELNDLGFKQADIVGRRLKTVPVDVIISSTFKRAEQTAEEINKHLGREIIFSDLFGERRSATSLTGRLKKEVKDIVFAMENNYGDFDWRYEDAESGGDLNKRAKEALDFILGRPESNIVVVTHGFFLRFMIVQILGIHLDGPALVSFFRTMRTNNTGITVVEYDDSFDYTPPWALRAWNDHSHLRDLIKED